MMYKKDLRHKYKELRKELKTQEFNSRNQKIIDSIQSFDPFKSCKLIHLFYPIKKFNEVDITYLMDSNDHSFCTSVTKFENNTLEHVLIDKNKTIITENKWGIPEPQHGISIDPKEIDLVFIPLLAFDEVGNRVGYGKGFYDRFLSDCKKDVLKIGVSMFEPEKKIKDVDTNDIPLDYCITPSYAYCFK